MTCGRRGERVVVGHRLRRRPGADHADVAGAAGRDRAPGGREDHLDHRDVVPLPGVAQHGRAGGVAGDDEGLHAEGDQVVEALEGVLADLADRLGTVGLARGVADVEHRLVRQLVDDRARDGEPAEAGVEDADGCLDLHPARLGAGLPPRMTTRPRSPQTPRCAARSLSGHAFPLRTALAVALVCGSGGRRSSSAAQLAGAAAAPEAVRRAAEITRVVVISVDGLNPDAITLLGAAGAPTFHRLVDRGRVRRSTPAARSSMTLTLPNHTGMVTSRRIDRSAGRARRHLERRPAAAADRADRRRAPGRLGVLAR